MLPDQFILYTKEWDAGKNKWQKLPASLSGQTINAHDRSFWTTYEDALRHVGNVNGGIAFVLSSDDPWFFLDLDNCFQDGQWSSEAQSIFLSFTGALGEVSLSGTGLHVLGKCDPSRLEDRRNKFDGWCEFYTQERFVALSTEGLKPIGSQFIDADWTENLLRIVPQREYLGDLPEGVDDRYTGPTDDDELIKLMLRSDGGSAAAFSIKATFKQLWEADAALAQFFPSESNDLFDRSSADAALMTHLAFWTGKDMPRMDRLFRRSGLIREKYERREDYRRDTIQNAARLCRNVYDYVKSDKKPLTSCLENEAYLTTDEMIKFFDGCVYIRDLHRVLVPDGALLSAEQFNAHYGGHMFEMREDGTRPSTKAFEAFTQSTIHKFPRAFNVCFRPDLPFAEIVEDRANMYVPANVDMSPGDIQKFLHWLNLIVPNSDDREIVLAFAAAVVQYPGKKFQWALVLQGMEGNGKTFLGSCIEYAVGLQYAYRPRASIIAEKFNQYLEGKVFQLLEEIHMEGRLDLLNQMKDVITNHRIEIRAPGGGKYMADNVSNWLMCTNYKDAVIKSRRDRRYAIIFTGQQEEGDLERSGMAGEFFPNLYDWARSGGYKHIAYYLRNYPIPDHLNPTTMCHRAPKTSSTDEAIKLTLGPVEAEISEAIESHAPGFSKGWLSTTKLSDLLRTKNLRASHGKRTQIIRELGFVEWGRSPRSIFEEGNARPMIYCRVENQAKSLEDYLRDQGYTA